MTITTIKISHETKQRLEKLKSHRRDSYEDIVLNILEILNTCRANPEKARSELIHLDRNHGKIFREKMRERMKGK